jgi:hypothetical protein
MPPYPPAAKTLRVALKHEWGVDADVLTRFFIAYAGTAPDVGDLETFANAVITAWVSDLASLVPNECALINCEVIDLSSDIGAVASVTTSHNGTRGTTQLTAATALVSSYTILRRYRGGHPRGYWPFGLETDLADAQDWTGGFLTSCATGLEAFFTAVLFAPWSGGGPLTQVNASYFKGFTSFQNPITLRWRNVPTLRPAPVIDLVTGIVPRPRVGSQRRRNEA